VHIWAVLMRRYNMMAVTSSEVSSLLITGTCQCSPLLEYR